jgi:ribosome-binding protein aMBF1 (putative translation factor)
MEKVNSFDTLPCRICGNETQTRFNISFSMAPICDPCAVAITRQQIDWMIEQTKRSQN